MAEYIGNQGTSSNDVGPHEFRPLGRFRRKKLCAHCYVPRDRHPVQAWTVARPLSARKAA